MIIQTSELGCGLDERLACVPSFLVDKNVEVACMRKQRQQVD
ncbi:hypothetical protein [Sorangium cellulosum]|nr:hypothetical protein [Sorangium cellulosum]